METDQYVTMTVFQLEKEFGDSEEAQAFIQEIISGAIAAIVNAVVHKLQVLDC